MSLTPWGLVDARAVLAELGPGEAAAVRLAALQGSLIRTEQLHFLGLSCGAIATRVRRGTLRSVHRGVHLAGGAPITDIQRCVAAVLACGPLSLLSHRAAAFLWGLLELGDGDIDLIVAGTRRNARPGIRRHSGVHLDLRDRRRRGIVPLVSPPLTLLCLAESVGAVELASAVNAARQHRLATRAEMLRLRERTPGRRGWAALRPFLDQGNDDFSRSLAEDALATLIDEAGLPAPRRNVRMHKHELDFFWPDLALNVEVDGYEWHSERSRLNADRERDGDLASRGIWVLRFTGGQVRSEPEKTIARLAAAVTVAAGRRT